jgi:hypothetical protein
MASSYKTHALAAQINSSVAAGQWYRLITCTVLHGGLLHLFMNCQVRAPVVLSVVVSTAVSAGSTCCVNCCGSRKNLLRQLERLLCAQQASRAMSDRDVNTNRIILSPMMMFRHRLFCRCLCEPADHSISAGKYCQSTELVYKRALHVCKLLLSIAAWSSEN